jgi:general secretion pathway protein I
MNNATSKQRGFTLLEVMIAVTVFALIAVSVSQATSISVDNQIHLEQKLIACWIAENETVLMRSEGWDKIKNGSKELEYANREWIINKKVKDKKTFKGVPVAIPLDIREVEISVALQDKPDHPLFTLTSFMAKDDA